MISIGISLPPETGKRKNHTKVENAAVESHNVKIKVQILLNINQHSRPVYQISGTSETGGLI